MHLFLGFMMLGDLDFRPIDQIVQIIMTMIMIIIIIIIIIGGTMYDKYTKFELSMPFQS